MKSGNIGHIALSAGIFALGIAALIFWLGNQSANDVLRLVADGRVVQGEQVGRSYSDKSTTVTVAYVVGGRRRTISTTYTSSVSRPVFDEDPIPVPRLGPENPMQIVYLPSDPAIARLRDDLKEARAPIYLATALFALIGLGFVGVGFVFRRVKQW